jgi:PAS domain S-box-containing protein/hemerythrin-like metal-binding protein
MKNAMSIDLALSNPFKRWSLKSRLTLLALAIVVISIWSLTYYAARILREEMQQQLGAQQFATVSLVAAGINEELSSRLAALEGIATEIDTHLMGNPAALQAQLENRPMAQSMFNGGVFITGADGTAIADVPLSAGRIGTNYIDRESVSLPLKEGKSVIGRPAMGKKLGAPIFSIVVPIRSAEDKVIGTLVGTINLGMPSFLDKITTGRYGITGGYLLIAPQHNMFVTATDKSRIMQPLPAAGINSMHDRYMQGYEGYGIATNSRGVEEVSAAKRIPIAGWFIAAVLPADEVFAPIRAMQKRLLSAMIFLTLLAGGLIWWIGSWMLRRQLSPMLAATKTLDALTRTNQLPKLLPVTSQDEIGELVGGFNRLLAALGEREDALRESEALFRAVSESAHDAIITADSSGNIIKWNPSAGQLFGYSESEAIGQSLTSLMPSRFRDRHVAGMSRVSAGGDPHVMGNPVELVGLRRDGSEFPLELSLARWQIADGNFFTGVIRDITERKKIEQRLADQRAHLEELVDTRTTELTQALEVAKVADQTKDAFLANMSHELRTPLSAVIGMANLARGISTDAKLRDYLEKIVRSGQHLNRIINELLDLSKIAAGRMELEIISFSLRPVIAHVESVMSHRAAEKGLTIVTVIDDAVPDLLLGDPTRLAQIFLNLIGNAIKFTEAGQITVRVSLQANEAGRVCLDIEFEDTGIGMRPEDLKQLFKPFSQADASVSRKFGGTGLGLTISRRLAEMMDGDISVTSIEGSGTTFKVRICLGLGNAADLLSPAPAADEVLPKRYQDARILVADDQPLNREIVEALLLAVGIAPRLAENGQEALDILTESGPDAFDLVLMDIQMPVMDGHAATRAVRRRSGFEKLPIIAMTAHTMAHEKEINAAAGMNDHIGKPFDNESFYRTLARWIDKAKQKTTGASVSLAAQCAPPAEAVAPVAETGSARDHLRGVNLANGLARFNGKEERYRHWLADFVENAGELPDLLRSDLAAGQPKSAARAAHAFRGRVGMLGMDDLHGVVSALEHALRDGTPTEALLGSLEQSIGEVRNELTQFFARDDVPGRPAVLEKMVWDDAYSVGVAGMDDQHKKLFGMINQLADCHSAGNFKSTGVFHEVLSRMFDYTQLHFKDEEAYLQRIGYPKLASHEGEHATFVEKITSFSIATEAGVQDEAAVHRYLKVWLQSHILESDMQYRDFAERKL